MVSQIINVIVNSKGTVTVARELDNIGNSAKSTATYLNGLRAVLAAALTFSGAGQIIETIDNFTALSNRLKIVAEGTDTVATSWNRLMVIANNSYATIDSTVSLYFRVAQAYKAWGESAESAFKFTELFQKAALLSGSTMQTTSQAVYQFSQSLNKGKLDGDEFRSVLEGLPYVANLIQKSLGVTRAELYKLSKDGQISVDRIKQAFEEAAATIQGDWSKITPTIGMALTVLNNKWIDFIGSIQTSTGIFSGFAYLILAVANNFTLLAIALSPVVISIGFLAGRLGLGLVVIGFKDLAKALQLATVVQWLFNAAVAANPYILVGIAIAAVIAGIVYFRNELGLTNEALAAMWTYVTTVFSSIIGYFAPITSAVATVVASFTQWSVIFIALRAAASVTGTDIVNMFTSIYTAVKSFVSYLGSKLAPLFDSLIALSLAFYQVNMDIVNIFVELLSPAVTNYFKIFKTAWDLIQPSLISFIALLKDIVKGWQIIGAYLSQQFGSIIKDIFEGWVLIIKTVVDWITRIINALRTAIALMKQLLSLGGGAMGGGGKTGGAHYGAQFKAGEGFATGGAFKVGGTGVGRDTTPVAFRAERGERVTVETKRQQRQSDNSNQTPSVNVPITNITVIDPNMMLQVMASASGERTNLNIMKNNAAEIKQMLGIV